MSKPVTGLIQEDKIMCNKYDMSPGIYYLNVHIQIFLCWAITAFMLINLIFCVYVFEIPGSTARDSWCLKMQKVSVNFQVSGTTAKGCLCFPPLKAIKALKEQFVWSLQIKDNRVKGCFTFCEHGKRREDDCYIFRILERELIRSQCFKLVWCWICTS